MVRVRPALGPSDPGYELIPQRYQRSTLRVPTPTSLSVESPQGRKIFIFDRVFGEDTTQKGIWDYLEDSVDSFLQGYNVSILAYGQSGAGKSYTMGTASPLEQCDVSDKGIIPRAVDHLFLHLEGQDALHSRQNSGLKTPTRYSIATMNGALQGSKQPSDKGWKMFVTYVEIYNEQPRDLLLPEGSSAAERATVQIREDPKGRIFVEGLRTIAVHTAEELLEILNRGSAIRQTDATAINSRSSRSHAVFTINLRQTRSQATSPTRSKHAPTQSDAGIPADTTVTIESKLHFVDLAGSERLKNTGATGDRAKEGISINAGLASLGKVISQLSSRSGGGYVSYRDSKLTRMLQDSLGGNAITYMVACVTPAEFHLSETLNTVQYAQRARNIQSKPQIQQINDDSDKQATIERLRTEVAFLRQQIRSSEGVEGRSTSHVRGAQTDVALQNELLDMQECYKHLSERHAKLVAELSRTAEFDSSAEPGTESAADRLKRSRETQQQIEQIITEYEKTIQSLESSLSTTRAALASTESNLLEKETKCAYIETMNQQLNSRVQKLMDREASTESYLHELEARLEDSTSGEEKTDAIVAELRKEIARLRESEINAEDYIGTLEERRAEADQEMEMLQREIERLEQLVQRQRSLGKLDNLLYELDSAQRGESGPRTLRTNGAHNRKRSEPMEVLSEELESTKEVTSPAAGRLTQTPRRALTTLENVPVNGAVQPVTSRAGLVAHDVDQPNAEQSKFMQEKFESVSQELFDLRLEHESTVNDLDLLSAKYQEALRTLAEMQDHLEETRNTPSEVLSPTSESRDDSFLLPRGNGAAINNEHLSTTRSLSSELSSVGFSASAVEQPESLTTAKEESLSPAGQSEMERLQQLLSQHETNLSSMKRDYDQLYVDHQTALDAVERLKSENRTRSPIPTSPGHGMIRRPTSLMNNSIDRGQRSVNALRALLVEEFEGKPDRAEGIEAHLTGVTHELNNRFDRIRNLESELQTMKKEMDMKTTIINGLQRERNSLKSGPTADLGMVSQMRDQLIQKEIELKTIHEGYGRLEVELRSEIEMMRKELDDLSQHHEKAKSRAEEHESKLTTTSAELAAALATVETLTTEKARAVEDASRGDGGVSRSATDAAMEMERKQYQDQIDKLKQDLDHQTSTNASHAERVNELTQMHEAASKDIHEHSQIIQEKSAEIEQHKVRIASLQAKIKETESAVEFHKHGLKTLHEAHATELEEMKLTHAGLCGVYDDQIAELNVKHGKAMAGSEQALEEHKAQLSKILTSAQEVLGHETSADMLGSHIQDLAEEKNHTVETNKRLVSTNAELEAQLTGRQSLQELEAEVDTMKQKISHYQETIRSLANEVGNHEETIRAMETVIKKHEDTIKTLQGENEKKVNLIEELEQQLSKSYEQHENRVSVIQAQGSQALTEAQQRIARLERDIQRTSVAESEVEGRVGSIKSMRPQSPLNDTTRSNSITNNLRKSASIVSLPSPPPAIPLPPLPSMPTITGGVVPPTSNPSPPQSRHASKEVPPISPTIPSGATMTIPKDVQTIKRQSAIIEDQDSRLRTMEKHLHAEKQLTATLEEALVDLETQSNKLRIDAEGWKKKAWALEEEVKQARKDDKSQRLSVQAVEEEKTKRRQAEEARAQLEERMKVLRQTIDGGKKKKKSTLNCF